MSEWRDGDYAALGLEERRYEGPGGACVAGVTPVCDTMDANLGYLQTSISF